MPFLSVVIFMLIFGAPIAVLGAAGESVAELRDISVAGLLILYIAYRVLYKRRTATAVIASGWVLAYAGFVMYLLLGVAFSEHRTLAIAVLVRLSIGLLLVIAVAVSPLRLHQQAMLTVASTLPKFFLGYAIIAFCLYIVLGQQYLEGLSGRHYSKFIALSGLLFSVAMIAKRCGGRLVRVSAIIMAATGLLCLQRGFILAAVAGVSSILMIAKSGRKSKLNIAVLVVVGAGVMLTILKDRILDYSFYDAVGPSQILAAVRNGTFNFEMLRTRGRLDLVESILNDSEITLLGSGGGTAKYIVGEDFGTGKEPHNDILALLVDYGVVGLFLFITFGFLFIKRALSISRAQSDEVSALAISSISIFTACAVWMTFSNVLIYAMNGFAFALMLLALSEHLTCRLGLSYES